MEHRRPPLHEAFHVCKHQCAKWQNGSSEVHALNPPQGQINTRAMCSGTWHATEAWCFTHDQQASPILIYKSPTPEMGHFSRVLHHIITVPQTLIPQALCTFKCAAHVVWKQCLLHNYAKAWWQDGRHSKALRHSDVTGFICFPVLISNLPFPPIFPVSRPAGFFQTR